MQHLDELRALNLPANQFAVFGSGPMAVHGLREVDDLDLIVKSALWEKLKQKYPLQPPRQSGEGYLQVGKIEIWSDWLPWYEDVTPLIDEAELIDGIRFVKLERVLDWKRQRNSEKDQRDIGLIEAYFSSR